MGADTAVEIFKPLNLPKRPQLSRRTSASKRETKPFDLREKGIISISLLTAFLTATIQTHARQNAHVQAEPNVQTITRPLDPDSASSINAEISDARVTEDFKLIYPGLNNLETAGALENLAKQEQIVKDYYLNNEQVYRMIAGHEGLIRKSAQAVGIPENLLLGLVTVESKGDPYAVSPAGAKGLSQMMKRMAQKYNIPTSDVDYNSPYYDQLNDPDGRFDPYLIIPATAKELKEAYGRWGNWSLAFWEWQVGAPRIYDSVRIYLRNQHNEYLDDVNKEKDDAKAENLRSLYKQKIADYKINTDKIFQDPEIQSMFEGEGWNLTDIYVARVLAVAEQYKLGPPKD